MAIQSFISDYCLNYNFTIFTSVFERKLAAGCLEEEDVGCWKEIVIPVVKSGRAASMKAPQLRAVRTHDQRDNRCADIKTPVLLTQHTDKKKKNRAQALAAIHFSAVSITEQIHRSESWTYCIASVIQRCILSALHVWLTGCFKPLTTCWRRDVSTAGRATAGTYTAPSLWPKNNTTCTTQSAISHTKGVKWQGVTW